MLSLWHQDGSNGVISRLYGGGGNVIRKYGVYILIDRGSKSETVPKNGHCLDVLPLGVCSILTNSVP